MEKKIFVIPAAGRLVLNPETGLPLPESGERVTASGFWDRRVADGSVSKGAPGENSGKKSKKPGGAAALETEG